MEKLFARDWRFWRAGAAFSVFWALLCVTAFGQEPAQPGPAPSEGPPAALLLMDSSLSMSKPAGSGRSRIEAARGAVRELVGAVPEDARLGLRVYGSRVNESTRAEGCRDTLLSVAVAQGNREEIVSTVEGLEPLGRTPIGRSLREAPDDFPEDAGRRTVVLVSDGGDNCAPPDPCEAAEDVAQQGVELTINVIGLQVSERVREELQCIAGAGGGVYADAENPEELTQELRAAFARSLRDYEPTGTPVEGGPQPGQAAAISEGQFLDDIGAGRQRWYEVRVEPGQRVWATAVALIPEGVQGSGGLEVRLLDSAGEEVDDEITLIDDNGGVNGPYSSQGLRGPPAGSQGGVYRIGVSLSTAFPDTVGLPMELLVYALDDGEAPGDIGPGRVLTAVEDEDGSPPERRDGDRPGTDREGDSGGDWPPAALGLGVVGLALGGVAGWTGVRRRRRRGS